MDLFFDFLNLKRRGLALDTANDLLRSVLGDNLIVVKHLKLLSGITAHEVHDSLGTTRVLIEPVGEVHDDTLDDNPQVILGVVLGNFLHGVLLLGDGESLGVIGLGSGSLSGGGRLLLASRARARSTAVSPLDSNLSGGRGVEMQRDLSKTSSAGGLALESLLEEVVAGSVTSNTAVDDTAEQRRTTKTVSTVDTTSQLTTGEETLKGLLLRVEDLGLVVDLNTTHGEVQNGLHESDVEGVINVKRHVVEETLAPWVFLLAVGDGVVGLEGALEVVGSAANLLGELLAGHLLHETAARVVASVEVKGVGGLGVEDEADGELALVLLLPHHTRDVITVTKLIAETVTISVEEETTLTAEGFGSQELPLGSGVLGVNETSGVNLDLVHVNAVTTNSHDHLLSVTSGVGAVGGGKPEGVGTVLLEQRALTEIGGVTTSGKNDGTANAGGLAVDLVGNTSDGVAVLVQASNAGLLDNLDAVGLGLGKLLDALHQSIGDGHTRELGIMTTVGTGLGVTTVKEVVSFMQLRDFRYSGSMVD